LLNKEKTDKARGIGHWKFIEVSIGCNWCYKNICPAWYFQVPEFRDRPGLFFENEMAGHALPKKGRPMRPYNSGVKPCLAGAGRRVPCFQTFFRKF